MGCTSSVDGTKNITPKTEPIATSDHQLPAAANSSRGRLEPILIFSQVGCPACFRVLVAAQLLQLDFENFEMDFDTLPDWFMQLNPRGTVPVIQHAGTAIAESSAIIEYMDELCDAAHGDGSRSTSIRLYPKDIKQRSRVRSISGSLQSDGERLVGISYAGDSNGVTFDVAVAALFKGLDEAEKMIVDSGGPFIFGAHLTAADITVVMILIISRCYFLLTGVDVTPQYPAIGNVLVTLLAMLGRKDFTDIFSPEAHLQFVWRYVPIAAGSPYHTILSKLGQLEREKTLVSANQALVGKPPNSEPPLVDGTVPMLETGQFATNIPDEDLLLKSGSDNQPKFGASISVGDSEMETVVCAATPLNTSHTNRDLKRRFTLLRHDSIGRGSYGHVYKAFDLYAGRYVAVKEATIPKFSADSQPQREHADRIISELRQEFETLLRLKHDGIVTVLALEVGRSFARIYMEWMPSGSLASVIKNTGPLPEATAARYFFRLLSTLAYVHEQGVVHRDIKPGNMLLSAEGTVKLSDFGTATLRQAVQEPDAMLVTGTVNYMSPDVINGIVDPANDIWALGVSINEIISGIPPWAETRLSGVQLMYHISKVAGEGSRHPAIADNMSPELKAILKSCFACELANRPTAASLLAHPYFAEAAAAA